jgi:hypothetical protein
MANSMMTKRTARETTTRRAMVREDAVLSRAQLESLWIESCRSRSALKYDVVSAALSGDDPAGARSFLVWLRKRIRDNEPIKGRERDFMLGALERYLSLPAAQKPSIGQAFGVERASGRRRPANRCGLVLGVNRLIEFLHESKGYPLTSAQKRGPTAFEIAAQVLGTQRFDDGRWFKVSAETLRTDYWGKREK